MQCRLTGRVRSADDVHLLPTIAGASTPAAHRTPRCRRSGPGRGYRDADSHTGRNDGPSNGPASVVKRDNMAIRRQRDAEARWVNTNWAPNSTACCHARCANSPRSRRVRSPDSCGSASWCRPGHRLPSARYHGVQTFGSSIHGGCQAGWSGTQNRQIVGVSSRLYLNAVCAGDHGEARIVQH